MHDTYSALTSTDPTLATSRRIRQCSVSRLMPIPLIALMFVLPLTSRGQDKSRQEKQEPGYEPTSQYEALEVVGWKVMCQKRLLEEENEVGKQARQLLRLQLEQISIIVPEPALTKLRSVTIWLDDDPRNQIHYHPERGWLVSNGFNPDRAKCVDIGRADRFVNCYDEQPFVVLHELAHAYHDQFLSFEAPDIRDAYQQMKERGQYEDVLHIRGHMTEHYALTNHKEYFAESTEAFFGTNDFYPFVRAELEEVDPVMYQVLRRAWLESE